MAAAGGGGGSASAIRLGKAYVEIFANDKALVAGLAGIKAKFQRFGASLTKIGAGGMLAGGGILGALGLAGKNALDSGGRLQDLSERLGATVEELSALGYAAELAGEGLDGVEVAVGKLQNAIATNKQVGGLNLQTLAGLPLPEQIDRVADAIAGVGNAELRGALATDIFGKSGRKMIPFLKDGAAGLAKMREEAMKLSGWTSKEASDLDRIGDALSGIQTGIMSFVRTIGGALFGGPDGIEAFRDGLAEVAGGIREIIKNNSALVQGLAIGGTVIAAAGAALTAFGFAAMGVSAGLGAIGAIITFLNPVTIAIGVALAGAAFALGTFVYWLREFTTVGSSFGTVWEGILNTIKSGSLAGAFRIAFIGAKLEFLKFIDEVSDHWAFRLMNPLIAGFVDLRRGQLRAEVSAIKAELDKAAAGAKEAAKKARVMGAVGGVFGLGGPTKGGFGTAGQLGQQFGIGDASKSLQNIDKNTAQAVVELKKNGMVFAA